MLVGKTACESEPFICAKGVGRRYVQSINSTQVVAVTT